METKTYAFRLVPGNDLRRSIEDFVREKGIVAGWVISCVGSLSDYHLRFANQNAAAKASGSFEILSLVGTISTNGCHLHICLANDAGSTIGGHLLAGCIIYTTAEIIIGTTEDFIFHRETDAETGWKELNIKENKKDIPR
jgi:predicted DNA-binding protein with PD1-like motif